jgi:hypothetical protein
MARARANFAKDSTGKIKDKFFSLTNFLPFLLLYLHLLIFIGIINFEIQNIDPINFYL